MVFFNDPPQQLARNNRADRMLISNFASAAKSSLEKRFFSLRSFFFFFLISKLRSNLNDFDRLNECRSTRMEFESNRSYFFICVIIFCRFGVCKSNPLKTLRCKCYFLKFILEIYYLENRFDD